MMKAEPPADPGSAEICRILSLDGGVAKGFYTLGVLKELEAMVAWSLGAREEMESCQVISQPSF